MQLVVQLLCSQLTAKSATLGFAWRADTGSGALSVRVGPSITAGVAVLQLLPSVPRTDAGHRGADSLCVTTSRLANLLAGCCLRASPVLGCSGLWCKPPRGLLTGTGVTPALVLLIVVLCVSSGVHPHLVGVSCIGPRTGLVCCPEPRAGRQLPYVCPLAPFSDLSPPWVASLRCAFITSWCFCGASAHSLALRFHSSHKYHYPGAPTAFGVACSGRVRVLPVPMQSARLWRMQGVSACVRRLLLALVATWGSGGLAGCLSYM